MFFLQGLKPKFAHITWTKRGINPKNKLSKLRQAIFAKLKQVGYIAMST